MRQATGREVAVNGRSVYVEESGQGVGWVVFEAGSGQGRTCWDAVVPLLADRARMVAYDRAGFGRGGRTTQQPGVDDMAADLAALVEAVVPDQAPLVLVAHSMGGLVARRAAENLGPRLGGLLLLDPTPETAPAYDRFDRTAKTVNRWAGRGAAAGLVPPAGPHVHRQHPTGLPPRHLQDHARRGLHPGRHRPDKEGVQSCAAAIHQFRAEPPVLSTCPTVLLSATRPLRRRGNQRLIAEHQRRFVETLPDGQFKQVDSSHFIQAEQPAIVADRVAHLLDQATRTTAGRLDSSPPV